MDPETHVIQAIIDFEYSGFYPSFFEGQFYRRVGLSIALNGEDDDTDRLIGFINSHKVGTLNCCVAWANVTQVQKNVKYKRDLSPVG